MSWKYKQHKGVYIHSMVVGYEHKRCTYKKLWHKLSNQKTNKL